MTIVSNVNAQQIRQYSEVPLITTQITRDTRENKHNIFVNSNTTRLAH